MSLRVLITGTAGLLGGRVVRHFPQDCQISATYNLSEPRQEDIPAELLRIDLTDTQTTERLLRKHCFDLVVNCAGASDVDRCELDHQYALQSNVTIVRNLVIGAKRFGYRLVHLSSDYVFGGKHGPSPESEQPAPLNFYGATKLMAEEMVRRSGITATIIRVCALYSTDIRAPGNIYKSIAVSLDAGKVYRAADDVFTNPTEVDDLAQAICQAIRLEHLSPVLHLAAPEYISRYQFAVKVTKHRGADELLVERASQAQLNLSARRPRYAGLSSVLSRSLLGRDLRAFSEIAETGG